MTTVQDVLLGRVKYCNGMAGEAEFSASVQTGDLCYFVDRANRKIVCRIVGLRASHLSGITGSFRIIDRTQTVPQAYTELYGYVPPKEKGAFLEIGEDFNGRGVQIRVNALFGHTVMTGKTHVGKTKLTIKMGEEMVKQRIPHLIMDTQGEHVGLQQFDTHVEDGRGTDACRAAAVQARPGHKEPVQQCDTVPH